MASFITAGNATNGLQVSSDNTGILELRTGTGSGTTALTANASQNVGIGTSSPGAKLHVSQGNISVGALFNGTTRAIRFGFDTTGSIIEGVDNTGVTSFQPLTVGGSDVRFTTSATERARITNSGDFYLGNTAGIVGNEKLSISQPTSAFWAQAIQLGNTANGTLYTNTSGTASYTAVSFRNNGTTLTIVGNITVSGTTVTYGSVSDYRLKENVQPMTNALAKVAELKPCTYTWKSDGSNGEGFIAHELQSVIPSSVAGEKDSVNEDGSINPQMVDTSFIVATLTAAIQELNAKVEAQAAEIAALKGNA